MRQRHLVFLFVRVTESMMKRKKRKKKKNTTKRQKRQRHLFCLFLPPPPFFFFFALTLKRRMTFFQINQHLLAGRIEKAKETENRSERETVKERKRERVCVKECASLLAVSIELRHLRVSVGLLRMEPLMFHGMFNSGDDWR